MGVVDALEMIQVDQRQAHGPAAALHPLRLVREGFQHGAAVEQAGEFVARGQGLDAFQGFLEFLLLPAQPVAQLAQADGQHRHRDDDDDGVDEVDHLHAQVIVLRIRVHPPGHDGCQQPQAEGGQPAGLTRREREHAEEDDQQQDHHHGAPRRPGDGIRPGDGHHREQALRQGQRGVVAHAQAQAAADEHVKEEGAAEVEHRQRAGACQRDHAGQHLAVQHAGEGREHHQRQQRLRHPHAQVAGRAQHEVHEGRGQPEIHTHRFSAPRRQT